MTIKKMPFRLYQFPEDIETEDLSKSVWLNREMRELIYSVGCMLRQTQTTTILRQALEIAEAELISKHKMNEILYGNGRRNKRKGLDDIEEVQRELSKILSKTNG